MNEKNQNLLNQPGIYSLANISFIMLTFPWYSKIVFQ